MNKDFKNILANLIAFFHIIIILFVIFAPFTNIIYLLILHVTFSFCLLVHWYNNDNTCSLSLFEAKLRNMNYNQTFSHKFISPIYDISESELSKICYTVVIITMIISIYKLYTLPKSHKIFTCIKNTYYKKISFFEKIKMYKDCVIDMMLP